MTTTKTHGRDEMTATKTQWRDKMTETKTQWRDKMTGDWRLQVDNIDGIVQK